MKIQTFGDIHGRKCWKQLVDLSCDKIVFAADYVDDYWPVTDEQIIENLLDIIQFKKDYVEKVILLLGNHDIQYLYSYSKYGCSGYRSSYYAVLHTIFNDNKDLFQIAFQIKNYVWTHAGISASWYNIFKQETKVSLDYDIATKINNACNSGDIDLIALVGKSRGGLHRNGGPLWADSSETYKNGTFLAKGGLHQIVGHSPVKDIITESIGNSSITYCDCLKDTEKTYIIEI
jgi:hypothetical protein